MVGAKMGVPSVDELGAGGSVDGVKLMRTVLAGFEKSDLRPLLDAIHDEIVWKSASRHEGIFRFHGDYINRPGVLAVLSKISRDYTFRHLKPKEVLAGGDIVWGHFDVSLLFDRKGERGAAKTVNLEMAIRWRLKDGKIIEHQAFFDTVSLLIQQGPIDAPSTQPSAKL
jgi:ketosteroid isomerase-like protein